MPSVCKSSLDEYVAIVGPRVEPMSEIIVIILHGHFATTESTVSSTLDTSGTKQGRKKGEGVKSVKYKAAATTEGRF